MSKKLVKEVKIDVINTKLDKKTKKKALGNRKTETDVELWARRFKEVRLYAQGLPYTEIGRQLGVSNVTVAHDIDAYEELMSTLDASRLKRSIIRGEELLRTAWNEYHKAVGNLEKGISPDNEMKKESLKIILDTIKELAILEGARKVEGTGDHYNLTQINVKELDEKIREKIKLLKDAGITY